MINDMGDEESCTKLLRRWSVLFYGVGHMLNDITSACWFTYLLVFLTDIGLSPRAAAAVMLSGQIADGFTTIFAGELIDRFGHFKIWHGAGSALVAVSFSSVFGGCIPCKILGTNSSTLQTIGYSTFAAIFNVGWASTQVSHMSMVNCITLNSTSRVVLASCRNAFTMVANLSLYAVAFIVFKVMTASTILDIENQYRWIAYLSIFVGCCFVGIFYLGTKEPRLKQGVQGKSYARISWAYWFKKVLYHQVALVYVLTRLVTNVSQAFLAFYVINDLQMSQSSKAVVPAIIYISSFIVSVLLQEIIWTGKRLKLFYSAGGILWLLCGAGVLFLPRSMNEVMYFLCIVIGIANALMMATLFCLFDIIVAIVIMIIVETATYGEGTFSATFLILFYACRMVRLYINLSQTPHMHCRSFVHWVAVLCRMVTAISMQSVLVGQDLNGCAFVYGSLSFIDKISCGIALYILESYQNTSPNLQACSSTSLLSCFSVTRNGLGLIPAICALAGVLVTSTMELHCTTSKPVMEPLLA